MLPTTSPPHLLWASCSSNNVTLLFSIFSSTQNALFSPPFLSTGQLQSKKLSHFLFLHALLLWSVYLWGCLCVIALCTYVTVTCRSHRRQAGMEGDVYNWCKDEPQQRKGNELYFQAFDVYVEEKPWSWLNLNLFFSGQPDASFTLAYAHRHPWHHCKEAVGGWFLMTFIHINEGCTQVFSSSQLAVHWQGSIFHILKLYSIMVSARRL